MNIKFMWGGQARNKMMLYVQGENRSICVGELRVYGLVIGNFIIGVIKKISEETNHEMV